MRVITKEQELLAWMAAGIVAADLQSEWPMSESQAVEKAARILDETIAHTAGAIIAKDDELRRERVKSAALAGPLENDHSVYVRSLPCCACGRRGLTEAAHVTHARGMGGANGDWSALAPLCGFDGVREGCHRLYDEDRVAFEERFPGCNPTVLASVLAEEYLEFRGGGRPEAGSAA